MAFTYVGGNTNGADSGTTASVTHELSISSGDLVVVHVNSNSNSTPPTIDSDTGGTWTTARSSLVTSETASEGVFWKIANGSEPSAYTATVGNANWRINVKVFTPASTPSVDAALTEARTGTADPSMICSAIDGVTISDDAVSIVTGGKDNRSSDTFASADNSYVSPVGAYNNQSAGMAHRIYTTGTTFSGSVSIDESVSGINDNTYSTHISFVEGGGGGGSTFKGLTLLGVGS